MSTYWPGNMRGLPVVKTPLLLLLLLLLSTLTGTVLCENGDDGSAEDTATQVTTTGDYQLPPDKVDDAVDSGDSTPSTTETTLPSALDTTEETSSDYLDTGSAEGPSVSTPPPEEEGLSPIIILIPVVLVVVIIGMIVCGIFINRRLNKSTRSQELRKEDPYLDGPSTEKVPMPMFEEDVPSVLELEMEELDEWMKKDGKSTEDSAHA